MDKFIIWLLFVVVCLYSVIDTIQTYWLFNLGFSEANPILLFFIGLFGGNLQAIIIVKIIVLTLLGFMLLLRQKLTNKHCIINKNINICKCNKKG